MPRLSQDLHNPLQTDQPVAHPNKTNGMYQCEISAGKVHISVNDLEVFPQVGNSNKMEVFTLLHEFLRIPSGKSEPRNSMEFQWKAIGWSLSHFGFQFHGNSNFFPRNSNGNGRNPRASRNDSHGNPWNSIGILLKFRWNPMGITIIYIVKNSYNLKN